MQHEFYNNPLLTLETKLEVAIGAIDFRDQTILNLRQQIKNLRHLLDDIEVPSYRQDKWQFSHLNNLDF